MTRALLATAISTGLAFSVAAQVKEQPGEKVDLKTLPGSVQQTINQKAAGGEIVRVKREDDANGRWNYESRPNEREKIGLRGRSKREIAETAQRDQKVIGTDKR